LGSIQHAAASNADWGGGALDRIDPKRRVHNVGFTVIIGLIPGFFKHGKGNSLRKSSDFAIQTVFVEDFPAMFDDTRR